MYDVKWNYNDVRMFSIESIKKTNVPSGLYYHSQSYYHLCSHVYNLWWRSFISKLEKSLVNIYINMYIPDKYMAENTCISFSADHSSGKTLNMIVSNKFPFVFAPIGNNKWWNAYTLIHWPITNWHKFLFSRRLAQCTRTFDMLGYRIIYMELCM